jgi:hypothetical protein
MIPGETVLSGGKHPGTDLVIMNAHEYINTYYLGFRDEDGMPYSRETEYMTKEQAEMILSLVRR